MTLTTTFLKNFALALIVISLIGCSNDDKPEPIIVEPDLDSNTVITEFILTIDGEKLHGNIDHESKLISFNTAGKEISSLKPEISYSEKATIEPSPEKPMDFTKEVSYTIYAENGDTVIYRVLINNRPLSNENKITEMIFMIDEEEVLAEINHDDGIIRANIGSQDLSSLIPKIKISQYATIEQDTTVARDYNVPVEYSIIAESGEVKTYQVEVNRPTITSAGGSFSREPLLFYPGSKLTVYVRFYKQNSSIFLFDGSDSYELEIKTRYPNSETLYSTTEALEMIIPDNLPKSGVYSLLYKDNIYSDQYEKDILDIVIENAPEITGFSQDVYEKFELLTIYGKNLKPVLVIPSNGNFYIIRNYGTGTNDLSVNAEGTELTLTLDNYYLFPSYYGDPAMEKEIIMMDEEYRTGMSAKVIFK